MYASESDCIDRRGEEALRRLADDRDADALSWTLLRQNLKDASEEIDSYLAARHDLPLDPVPRLLVRLGVDIGIYLRAESADLLADQDSTRYAGAIRLLRDIAAGRAALGIADPDPPAPAAEPGAEFAPGLSRVMTRGSLGRVL